VCRACSSIPAGVIHALSGYSGGSKGPPTTTVVSSGATGHAEAVEIKYDPKKIGYGKILQISSRWRTIRPS